MIETATIMIFFFFFFFSFILRKLKKMLRAFRSAAIAARPAATVQVRGMAGIKPGTKKVPRDKYMRGVV
jgi:hypothetical protein